MLASPPSPTAEEFSMQRPLLPFVTTLLFAAPASAGGYDTPMLYTAEHMGGGGAAVAWVDDQASDAALVGAMVATLV